MDQDKLSLSTEDIKVDFLRFNFQFIDKSKIQEIANYLWEEYSCNSVFIDKKKTYSLIEKRRFSCKGKFLTSHIKYWIGTRLEFDGGHGYKFYQMIKKKALNWDRMDLENTNLGRIDLYYDRKLKESDQIEDFDEFLKSTAATISSGFRPLEVDLKPGSLAIGNRKTSSNYFRIYKRSNGRFIRFELEISLEEVKKFQFSLFTSQFENLEMKLIQHYYSYITTRFEIERSCYTDWLLENFRKIRSLEIPQNSLVSTYLTDRFVSTLAEKDLLYKLFQL